MNYRSHYSHTRALTKRGYVRCENCEDGYTVEGMSYWDSHEVKCECCEGGFDREEALTTWKLTRRYALRSFARVA